MFSSQLSWSSGHQINVIAVDHLDQMDDYSLLAIFDHLNFNELINMADTNTKFRALILMYYMKPKYKIHENVIYIAMTVNNYDGPQNVVLHEMPSVLKFLRIYGPITRRIKFSKYLYDNVEVGLISRYIEKYCSKTLQELSLPEGEHFLLNEAKETFDKVQTIDFTVTEKNLANLQIHRIYPNMKTLKMYTQTPFASSLLAYPCQNLTHLEYRESENFEDFSYLQNLFQSNPQLQSLNFNKLVSFKLLEAIRDHLPNLKTLSITRRERDFFDVNQTIHFVHVKNLILQKIVSDFNERNEFPITFSELNSLEIASLLHPPLIDLIQKNKSIQRLSLMYRGAIDSMLTLLQIVKGLDELQDITFWWSPRMQAKEVVQFFKEMKELKRVTFISWARDLEQLFSAIPENWANIGTEIVYVDIKRIVFERTI